MTELDREIGHIRLLESGLGDIEATLKDYDWQLAGARNEIKSLKERNETQKETILKMSKRISDLEDDLLPREEGCSGNCPDCQETIKYLETRLEASKDLSREQYNRIQELRQQLKDSDDEIKRLRGQTESALPRFIDPEDIRPGDRVCSESISPFTVAGVEVLEQTETRLGNRLKKLLIKNTEGSPAIAHNPGSWILINRKKLAEVSDGTRFYMYDPEEGGND